MEGHLAQKGKGGPWYVVFYRGRDEHGKKRYDWHRGGPTREEAERERVRLLRELHLGTYIEPNSLTVGDFLDQWLGHVATTVRPKTAEFYNEAVRKYLAPALGQHRLAALQPLHIQTYYSRALTSGRIQREGGLSPRTVHHHHNILNHALNQAVRWQLLARNPVAAVDPPRVERTEMRFLTEDETAQLLTTARGHVLYLPILIALSTGLRRGEILGLTWGDVDLKARTMAISRSINSLAGPTRADTKSRSSRRTISVSGPVIAVLEVERASRGAGPAQSVCVGRGGTVTLPNHLTSGFGKLARQSGLDDLRFHDLRHTHVAHLIREGVHVKVISDRLGHSSIAITMNTYGHLLPHLDQEAADRLDGLFGRLVG